MMSKDDLDTVGSGDYDPSNPNAEVEALGGHDLLSRSDDNYTTSREWEKKESPDDQPYFTLSESKTVFPEKGQPEVEYLSDEDRRTVAVSIAQELGTNSSNVTYKSVEEFIRAAATIEEYLSSGSTPEASQEGPLTP